ncbi:MAG TPA: hypothetical protein VMU30_05510 [Bacteroidota bacterium]|nr:hypothetical protein [Bacteroidota bacterium]
MLQTPKRARRQTMWDGVEQVLDDNSTIIAKNKEFLNSVQDFETTKQACKAKFQLADNTPKGKVEVKDKTSDALITSLKSASASLCVFAHKTNNTELETKMDIPPSHWTNTRDTVLVDEAQTIIDQVDANATALTDHGFTADNITQLKTRLANYSTALAERLGSTSEGSSGRETAEQLAAKTDDILVHEIDRYAQQVEESEPEFYKAYTNARTIKNLGIRHKKKEEKTAAAKTADAKKTEAAATAVKK